MEPTSSRNTFTFDDFLIGGPLQSAIGFEHCLPNPFYSQPPDRRPSGYRDKVQRWIGTSRPSMTSTKVNVIEYLSELCEQIKALSDQSVLHPSKCRCLAQSYSALVQHLRSLISPFASSSSPFLPPKLSALLAFLAYILLEGKRFIQDCTLQEGKPWLLTCKGLTIPFSTEIFDVHLHDFVWCISMLIFTLSSDAVNIQDAYLQQAITVEALLMETWALADEEGDVEKMQDLFHKIGAKGQPCEQICKLIHDRLSDSTTSKAKVNLTRKGVPEYLWMDRQGFTDKNECLLGSSFYIVVFETSLMKGRFAFKHFHRHGSDQARFTNEAVVQAGLRHANIVRLVCCSKRASSTNGLASTTNGLVIELMDQDLCSFISEKREDASFSLLARLDLILQIANGMQYLHDLGIMHRDLKSLNILISCSGSPGNTRMNAKIADFGTAKVKHHTSMFTTKPIGTSIWRAPEVLDSKDNEKYTKKADVYSFAIVCSEILTGLPPDKLFPSVELGSGGFQKGIRPELPSRCPNAIASYIKKCWDADASKRPSFNQICRVFRVLKACEFLREKELLATPLEDDMFENETAADRWNRGMFYHPVFDILSEMQTLRCSRAKDFTTHMKVELLHWINRVCLPRLHAREMLHQIRHFRLSKLCARREPMYVDPQGEIHLNLHID